MDRASQGLMAAWKHCLQDAGAEAVALLQTLAPDVPPALAGHFYAVLLEDPRAARYLSHDQVRQHLQPSMQRWLQQLLLTDAAGVETAVAAQRVIGDVHARVGIPVDLVTRGARVLKRRLFAELQARARAPEIAFQAINCISAVIDIAMEGMTLAYAHARERSARTDSAYRLFSLVQNVSTERERQRALLLDWENSLLYALASQRADIEGAWLAESEFGLWFTHKGRPSFGESSETSQIGALIKRIDARLPDALTHGDFRSRMRALLHIRKKLEQIRTLLGMLFERVGELDAGSDALTHLLNRRFLPTVLRREIELSTGSHAPFAVLLLDLDHFKVINDTHGHDGGDRALQHVAGLLGQFTRGSDYVFRYGGEEFVIVLVAASEDQAVSIAENLRGHIARSPLTLPGGQELALTASVGVAVHDGHPDFERLMARADAAMYEAKKRGRNRVVLAREDLPPAPDRRMQHRR
jgi:diguanylate cyclase